MKKNKYKKYFPYVLFGIYITIVFWLTLIKRRTGYTRATLIPFWEYKMVVNNVQRSFFIGQIIGNIALFVPLGFMFPILSKFKNVKFVKVLLIGLCFSVVIEMTQYVTGRGLMEFDDVFNNTLGAVVGYGAFKLFKSFLDRHY